MNRTTVAASTALAGRQSHGADGLGELPDGVLKPFVVHEPAAVRGFLSLNPDLATTLQEAPAHIEAVFGRSSLSLELFTEPEGETGQKELWIIVHVSLGPEEALDRLRLLDQRWRIELPRSIRKRLRLDVELA